MLLVIAFHVGGVVTGGFVGVDVFFVISGFVIALSLQRELAETGTVRLRNFYARRARRLLPALALISLVVLVVASRELDVLGAQQTTAQTARAAALFVANLHLESGGGYFATSASENPLLHTWSLSVEEQFYFAMPAFMLVAWRFGARRGPHGARSRTKLALTIATVLSFVVAVVDVSAGHERSAFFGTPARAWEFAVGALLALNAHRLRGLNHTARTALAVVGAGALVVAAFVYSPATPFPGTAAVVPVLATAALIAAGSGRPNHVSALSWRPLVWIGDRSYSWYLWHWPAIVFASVAWGHSTARNVVIAAVSLVPAAVSHSLLEQPLRRERGLVGLSVATLVLVVITSTVAWSFVVERDADERLAESAPELVSTRSDLESPCGDVPWPADSCIGGPDDPKGTVVLVGDSHAIAVSDVVTAAAGQLGLRTATLSRPGCPASTLVTTYSPDCTEWIADLVPTIRSLQPDAVVIVNRSPAYVRAPVGQPIADMVDEDGDPAGDEARSLELWGQGLRALLDAIDAPTLILRTVPEYPNGRLDSIIGTPVDEADVPVLPRSYLERRSGAVAQIETQVAAERRETIILDPTDFLCEPARCHPQADDKWLYFDDDHLSSFGSWKLAAPIRRELRRLLSGELRLGNG